MEALSLRNSAAVLTTMLLCALLSHTTLAQQKPAPPANQSEEVVRTRTELVQTDLMVFDKQGKFYDGLKQEQFELRVDKKPRAILFFERIRAGSANEEVQLAAARGGASGITPSQKNAVVPLDRGRTVFFYVDDLHLSPSSTMQARTLLLRFIEREMGQNDEVAVTSSSGQIGFLQQLTDNKEVLRRAVERLKSRPTIRDFERPPMSGYQALLIDKNDQDAFDYFVAAVLREFPGLPRLSAEEMVRSRAHQIVAEASNIVINTLSPLEGLINYSRELSGRKLLFVISDGFFLDPGSDGLDRLRRITSAAARAGVVIYSMDARGLAVGLPDASSEVAFDPSGRLDAATMGELSASRDGLNALARDTGGRAFFNSNDLSAGVKRALNETSSYYLIAWRPESEEQRAGKSSRIEVNVIGRPDLVVRLRRGVADREPLVPVAKHKTKLPRSPESDSNDALRAAITSLYPAQSLPTALGVHFLDTARTGSVVACALEVPTDALSFTLSEGKPTANVDIAAAVYDTEGKVAASFQNRLTIKTTSPDPNASRPDNFSYNGQFKLKPGLYQVRVAVHDETNGRAGSARQWIKVPDLNSRKMALSSLILGGRTGTATERASQADALAQATLSVDHRFARAERLRFLIFVYNAARRINAGLDQADLNGNSALLPGIAVPDVAVQVQVLRDNQPVITSPLRKVAIDAGSDVGRAPYAAEITLSDLQPGRYVLQVTMIDRIAKTSATEQTVFVIN
ncbi:MAG TPA: VWA domain-containing protein [Pyrinomonadaceae bacterium]|jgi:VWFA-related protein